MIANAFGLADPGGEAGAAQALCVVFGFTALLAVLSVKRIGNAAANEEK